MDRSWTACANRPSRSFTRSLQWTGTRAQRKANQVTTMDRNVSQSQQHMKFDGAVLRLPPIAAGHGGGRRHARISGRLAALRIFAATLPCTCSWPAPCAPWPLSACAWRHTTAALRNGRPGRYGEGRRWGRQCGGQRLRGAAQMRLPKGVAAAMSSMPAPRTQHQDRGKRTDEGQPEGGGADAQQGEDSGQRQDACRLAGRRNVAG